MPIPTKGRSLRKLPSDLRHDEIVDSARTTREPAAPKVPGDGRRLQELRQARGIPLKSEETGLRRTQMPVSKDGHAEHDFAHKVAGGPGDAPSEPPGVEPTEPTCDSPEEEEDPQAKADARERRR